MLDYARLADVVCDEIQAAGYITNACILAARMTTYVLRHLGVDHVEAMACEVDAFSPAYVAMRAKAWAHERELTEAEMDPFVEAGAWRVQLQFGPAPPGVTDNRDRGYEGHVVTLVKRRWLIDPTLRQVNRPEKDLIVEPPLAFEIDFAEALSQPIVTSSSNGTHVFHRLLPDRRDFVKAPDWRLVPARDRTILRIMDRLTGVLQ